MDLHTKEPRLHETQGNHSESRRACHNSRVSAPLAPGRQRGWGGEGDSCQLKHRQTRLWVTDRLTTPPSRRELRRLCRQSDGLTAGAQRTRHPCSQRGLGPPATREAQKVPSDSRNSLFRLWGEGGAKSEILEDFTRSRRPGKGARTNGAAFLSGIRSA